jgi:hypothetical protein
VLHFAAEPAPPEISTSSSDPTTVGIPLLKYTGFVVEPTA